MMLFMFFIKKLKIPRSTLKKTMKYQEIKLEINAPIDFVFDFISLHQNFEKMNVASSFYEAEFLDKDLISNGGSVKAGVVYNIKIQVKDLIFYIGCSTLAVEKNKLIKYRYIYTDAVEENPTGMPLEEETKDGLLNYLNRTPFEGSWEFKDLGNSKTQLGILVEINGNMSFFQRIYHWYSSLVPSKYKKESALIFHKIGQQIEVEYQSK
jgi:hypothetical protein